MLYSHNLESKLDTELFKKPTSAYRGAPFWAWNTTLDKEQLVRQIDSLKKMGMGGFHIHSRTGMGTNYLSEEFMELVRTCNEKAKEVEMLCWLYDEDRWPSGFAGGLVTKDIRFRARWLRLSTGRLSGFEKDRASFEEAVRIGRSVRGYWIASYGIHLEDGYLKDFKRLSDEHATYTEGDIWHAYLEISESNPWFNNQTYVNTLDPKAIEKFIEITHETYAAFVGEDFGKSIPAIFTDEPQFTEKECLRYGNDKRDLKFPFTDDLDESFLREYGYSLLDALPELIWQLPEDNISATRYRYHDHVSERFASAFADTIGNWCQSHGLMLTGHMMEEPSLFSQTKSLGEAMRSYRSFQLPGIDMLCDGREYSTAKQAQSAARQYGCPGVISELYGVTNWDFDFKGHKLAGDWQAALGVTTRVHHLSWVSMEGESKRDFPASINYQSPWYEEYPLIEDHFSRLNTALTRGKAHVKVGVIHPIESYWLYWGPVNQTNEIRQEMENNFQQLIRWLLFGLIDFDFIAESLFPELTSIDEVAVPLQVGQMNYDVLLVPGCVTLRTTTLERLKAFQAEGGTIVFIGEPATYIDAVPSQEPAKLAMICERIPYSLASLMKILEGQRELDIRDTNGARTTNILYQMREELSGRWLFLCHAEQTPKTDIVRQIHNQESTSEEQIMIQLKGLWKPLIYDTLTGEILEISYRAEGNETIISYVWHAQDSLLLFLESLTENNEVVVPANRAGVAVEQLEEPTSISLAEPNALLLDRAVYSFDDGRWEQTDEILKIDNLFREKLNYPQRTDAFCQPWVTDPDEREAHTLTLKFIVHSDVYVNKPELAMEYPERTLFIQVNGVNIEPEACGWYVDEAIKRFPIPDLQEGRNEIIVKWPFGPKTNIEWCYLLGAFGVKAVGKYANLLRLPETMVYGDWTQQGLPFYGGNVTYHVEFQSQGEEIDLEVPHYKGTLLTVDLDGSRVGPIALEPNRISLGYVARGSHWLAITVYGNRYNAFGSLHNCSSEFKWYGPNAWRTQGIDWADQYQIKPMGILVTPRLIRGASKSYLEETLHEQEAQHDE